jgi:hypothetical protein
MVAQAPHDTPTATRQSRALSPDYQRRGFRPADLPCREPQTAPLLLVKRADFVAVPDRCADRAPTPTAILEPPATMITSLSITNW